MMALAVAYKVEQKFEKKLVAAEIVQTDPLIHMILSNQNHRVVGHKAKADPTTGGDQRTTSPTHHHRSAAPAATSP